MKPTPFTPKCQYFTSAIKLKSPPFPLTPKSSSPHPNHLQMPKFHPPNQKQITNQYFPQKHTPIQDESINSSQTTKKKNTTNQLHKYHTLPFGIRPKSSKNSITNSDRNSSKSIKSMESLENQINTLNQQLVYKDKALLSKLCFERIKQSQMTELYRIIAYYQGKLTQQQLQLTNYQSAFTALARECDEKAHHRSAVEQLVQLYEGMRKNNEQLCGKLEVERLEKRGLENKNYKLQVKLNFVNSKSNFLKKSTSPTHNNSTTNKLFLHTDKNQLKSLQISSPYHTKLSPYPRPSSKNYYGNIQSKINKIQSSLVNIKKENYKLQELVDQKELEIYQLQNVIKEGKNQGKVENNSDDNNGNNRNNNNSNNNNSNHNNNININNAINNNSINNNNNNERSKLLKIIKKQDPPKQPSTKIPTKQPIQPSSLPPQPTNPILPKTKTSQPIIISSPQKQPLQQLVSLSQESHIEEMTVQKLIDSLKAITNTTLFLKLRYHLITQDITHQQLLKVLHFPTQQLLSQPLPPQTLRQSPYNLNISQTEQFSAFLAKLKHDCQAYHYNSLSILEEFVPKYSNLTIRKENSLKIQISNQTLNREQQINAFIANNPILTHEQIEHYFREWGFSQQHLDVLCKCYYQQSGKIDQIDMKGIKILIDQWSQK